MELPECPLLSKNDVDRVEEGGRDEREEELRRHVDPGDGGDHGGNQGARVGSLGGDNLSNMAISEIPAQIII